MTVTRGLIIADPWIGHILEGRKDWEMRARPTAHRGWFGLVRKGSGQVVGLARLVDCGKALSQPEMIASQGHHRIPETLIRSGAVSKWIVPWKLSDIRALEQPVPYAHNNGAVTWVTFSEEVSRQLQSILDPEGLGSGPEDVSHNFSIPDVQRTKVANRKADDAPLEERPPSAETRHMSNADAAFLGRTRISGGNLRNSHFYLTEFLDRFPADCIGGRNKQEAASRELVVDWGGPSPVRTDIDRSKRMFRRRGWVRQFFLSSGAREGDTVLVTSSAPYRVHVRVERDTETTRTKT